MSKGLVLALTLIIALPAGARGEATHRVSPTPAATIDVIAPNNTSQQTLSFGERGLEVTNLDTQHWLAPAVPLRFHLESSQPMRLEILDDHGRLVRTLAQGRWAAGTHQLAWHQDDDAGRLMPGGQYTARLVSEDEEVGFALADVEATMR